ncbi:MAG: orotate phosphoribosyltransferase [Thaumarchaeota archaeon]|nr:orotate phosphoribosyltransferase [Nitrososphaerota archaeon]
MDFVKEFAIFLHQSSAIKFGTFRLSSGKESAYYVDLRLVPSFPHQFRKMIKNLQEAISGSVGLDSFDCIASVPTSGLVIAAALATETVKPLAYVRQKPKDYGTGSLIEGRISEGTRVLLVDDVGTTGQSIIRAVKALKDAKMSVKDAFVVINRLEGAAELLASEGVRLHEITDVMKISEILFEEELLDGKTLERIRDQMRR